MCIGTVALKNLSSLKELVPFRKGSITIFGTSLRKKLEVCQSMVTIIYIYLYIYILVVELSLEILECLASYGW